MHVETLPKTTERVLASIKSIPELKNFYLSGGTALALLLGHRESEDLDFFSNKEFSPQSLQQRLSVIGPLQNVEIDEGTLNTFFNNVKLQFLYYPYKLIEKPVEWNGIFLSSVIDIACTKLITISARGSKKDFIDMYIVLKQITLQELFKRLDDKYQNVNYNHAHILKSLVYFEDAETQPMPRMHVSLEWQEVKKTIIEKVKEFQF